MGTIELKETLSKVQIEGLDGAYFEQGKITHGKFIAAKKKVVLELQLPRTLPLEQLQCFNDGLIQLIGCPVELRISADVCDLDSGEMLKYCKYFSEHSRYGQGLRDAIPTVKDQVVDCLFTDETLKQQALACREELDHFMQNAGVSYDFEFSCRAASFTQIEVKMPKEAPKPQAKPAYSADKPSYRSRRTKMEDYTVLALKEINDEIQNVQFTGTIFEKDSITIKKTGNEIQTLYVKDNDDAITCKRFESARCPKEKLNEVGVGDDVRVYGSVRYDSFSKELVFFPDDIVKLEKKEEEQDTADVKRVELHCHTN
ncbi:MAG: PolC-type DNA polymerase III, partial [Holdemania filiformis]